MMNPLHILASLTLLLAPPAGAQVLMLDFGSLNVADGDPLNSPYHSINPGFEETAWNQIQTADIGAGGLVFSDGLAAAGISLDLGISTANGSSIVNFGSQPLTSTSGSGGAGIFAGPSAARDFVNSGPSGTGNQRLLGVGILGLGAGDYEVYLVGMNTNVIGSSQFWAAAGAPGSSFDVSPLTAAGSSNSGTAIWAEGTNYVRLSVAITETNSELYLIAGGTSADLRGTFNAIQIVAVPEPSGFALAVAGAFACWGRRRQRPVRQ
jgi:hypothetical protein